MISQELRAARSSATSFSSAWWASMWWWSTAAGRRSADMLKKLGKQSRFVDGLRCTDDRDHGRRAAGALRQGEQEPGGHPQPPGRAGHRPVRLGRPALFQAKTAGRRSTVWWASSPRWTPAPVRDVPDGGLHPRGVHRGSGAWTAKTPTTSTPTRLPPGWRWLWGQRSSSSSPTCAACCRDSGGREHPSSRRWACPRCPCWCGSGVIGREA